MRHSEVVTEYKYFAAANGYDGFRSYFDSVFKSSDFKKIYVLKGGPGTGKSSLMKSVSRYFSDKGVYNEAIYCSSDPDSLDGVIVEINGKRAAVLDGTAPHERDATIPGAIDELINLGECWDSDKLEKRRAEILSLNEKKKIFYNDAYGYLALIGEIDSKIKAEYLSKVDFSNIVKDAEEFIKANLSRVGCTGERTRLTSSFGKSGYLHFDTLSEISKCTIRVKGDGINEFIYMKALYDAARALSIGMTVAPSPFDKDEIEELYFPEEGLTISAVTSDGRIYDANKSTSGAHPFGGIFEYLLSVKKTLLEYARLSFQNASETHFSLEKIYTGAMCFEKNRRITEELIFEIEKKLSGDY